MHVRPRLCEAAAKAAREPGCGPPCRQARVQRGSCRSSQRCALKSLCAGGRKRHRHRRLLQQLQQHKVAGRRPPAELPSHPAPSARASPPCLRASSEGAQNLTKTGTGHVTLGSRRSLQRLQRQRAYAHVTKQLTRGVSSINRTRRVGEKIGDRGPGLVRISAHVATKRGLVRPPAAHPPPPAGPPGRCPR